MFVTETVFEISVCSRDFGGSEVARFPKSASKIKGGRAFSEPCLFLGSRNPGHSRSRRLAFAADIDVM
jgi:hypothetical protein